MSRNKDYRTGISLEEAIATLRAHAPTLATERVGLLESYGRTLAEDVSSLVDHPSCDNSALDGYACREADTLSASEESPVRLRVVGEVPAGGFFEGSLSAGEAVSIYTGAPVPAGADAIIMVERTEQQGDMVSLKAPASPKDIRPRAQDLKAGETYLRRGMRLHEGAVGVAASMGHATLAVTKRPRVALLITGDEVIEPGEPIRDGQIYNSNLYTLALLIRQAGGEAVLLPRAVDDAGILRTTLESAGQVDLLLTSGGVSMGKYDLVRDLLFDEGTVHYWKVAIRPGGPAIFGEWRGLPVFGLPGNPVSSMVVFYLITQAFLQAALGSTEGLPLEQPLTAEAETPFGHAGAKTAFWRGVLRFEGGRYLVRTSGNQSSGVLNSMLSGNCLVMVLPQTEVAAGQQVAVIPLR